MSEDRVYTIATGMKIFYGVLAVILLVVGIFLFSAGNAQSQKTIMDLFAIGMLTGAVLIFVNIVKRQVIISDSGITNANVFVKRELSFTDIKGARVEQKFIKFESADPNKKGFTIGNYIDLGDSEQLAAWVRENFTDLDAVDLKHQEEEIAQDVNLGYTLEDRQRKLNIAKQIAVAYSLIGFVGTFALLFLVSKQAAITMGLIWPLLAIPIMMFSKGLIKFIGNRKRSVNPYIFIGFMGPAMVLLFNCMDSYQVFDYHNLWLPIVVAIALVVALVYYTGVNKAIGGLTGQLILMFFLTGIYGFGGIISLNCTFDNSSPTIYKAEVLGHRIESGKHTSYLLTLSEWGPMHKQKEEDVGRWIYDRAAVGNSVEIYLRKGLLKAPWYYVDL